MADLSDVEAAIVAAVDGVRVAFGASWTIYRGWPVAATLDAALAAGQTHVTVWPDGGMYRLLTVYQPEEMVVSAPAPTLTVSVAAATATFAGTCSTDQIAGVQVGSTAWAYRCVAGDTPSSVAVALAALSGGAASGSTITLAGLADAQTGRDVSVLSASRRQEAGLRVTIWAADPGVRDSVSSAIDGALADLGRISLADGTAAVLRGAGSISTDKGQQADFYRRDLRYHAEYTTTVTSTRTPVLWPGLTYAPGSLRLGALHP